MNKDDLWLKLREFLSGRKQAYVRVFNKQDRFANEVLKDLATFCRATETTFHADPYMRSQLDGRREVWLRIQHHLQLTDDELWERYSKKES